MFSLVCVIYYPFISVPLFFNSTLCDRYRSKLNTNLVLLLLDLLIFRLLGWYICSLFSFLFSFVCSLVYFLCFSCLFSVLSFPSFFSSFYGFSGIKYYWFVLCSLFSFNYFLRLLLRFSPFFCFYSNILLIVFWFVHDAWHEAYTCRLLALVFAFLFAVLIYIFTLFGFLVLVICVCKLLKLLKQNAFSPALLFAFIGTNWNKISVLHSTHCPLAIVVIGKW